MGDEGSAEQTGREPGDGRFTGSREAGDENEERLTGVIQRSCQSEVPNEGPSEFAHFVERKFIGSKPADFGGFVVVRSRDAINDRGIKGRHDVGRLIAVGIGHAVFGSSEYAKDVPQLYGDTGFLCNLTDGTFLRTLVGFNRAADEGPIARIDQTNEKNASGVITRQDSGRWEQQKFVPHLVSKVADVGRDHDSNVPSVADRVCPSI